ncbi:hypothetical protein NKR19_g10265 [Coniochaeta hoffmannii]|uniref:Uncharacterized protein n=1 Tax=Coniochaeta hoffmannii TaxID=91930 RepID=A0AA38RFR4_9PEZI|nr:hypothetical protein NKR19_g10265 [Coniochaeta hoffmannii]
MDTTRRTLYVLVYPSRLFAAHWSFWVPYLDANGQESHTGDRIHVTGDRLNGFEYEYIRDYNVREDERKPNAHPIGLLPAAALSSEGANSVDSALGTVNGIDNNSPPFNLLDRACREVEAPGPSLNRVATGGVFRAAGPPPKKAEVRDCQWWVKQAVAHLAEANMLLPLDEAHGGGTPSELVERLPRH